MKNSADFLTDHLAGRYQASPFPYATPFSLFHEMNVQEFSPLIELDPSNGLSTHLRDTIEVTGDGSVTEPNGELLLSTGASAGSTAMLSTKERGRYQSGIEGLGGHEVRLPVMPTGDQVAWWEYGDGIDAARVGADATGYFVQFVHHDTVDDPIYQDGWNLDRLNGEGGANNLSGIDLDQRYGVIWRTRYTHYGVGPAIIEAFLFDEDGRIMLVPVHMFRNRTGEIFWSNPKLPLRQYVDNGTTGGNLELYVGGRHFAVKGRYNPNRRQTPGFASSRTIPTTEFVPICSFQKKADRKWRARSIKVSGMGVLTDQDLDVAIVLGATLTGESFGNPELVDASETAMAFDESATAFSGGTAIDGALAKGGRANRSELSGIRRLGADIPDDTVVTLVARARTSEASAGAAFTLEEEA